MNWLDSFWQTFINGLENKKNQNKDISDVFISIIKQTKPITLSENEIILGCDNIGIYGFLQKKLKIIETLLKEDFKKNISVNLKLVEKKHKKTPPPLLTYQPNKEDVFIKAGLNLKYSFENFAVSSTNQVAYAAAQAIVNNLGNAYNPLFLYGGVGVGKTHLAQAVARKILEIDQNKKVLFCPGDNFTNELIEAIQNKNTNRFRKKYRQLDLLIVDDIQFIAGKLHVQEEFFHTFNSIITAGGQIILTSDRPPYEIKNLQDRLRSRFSGGLTIDIQPPDFELRCAILLIKAKEKKIEIEMPAVKIIAERINDARALEGTLLSLYAKILGKKEIIDLEVVDNYFSEKKQNNIKKVTPADVIRCVCSFYNIKQSHLKSGKRTSNLALPRQIVMYILRQYLKMKYEEIAFFLKKKDHTTIIHAERKIEGMLLKNPVFKKEVDNITQSLFPST
ncbi:MAG: chromosomal replication initiator protein DnaA [Microgenomates group bacterium]